MQGRAVTDEQITKLLDGLRLGMTRRAASGHAGFSKTTFYRMLEDDPDGTLGTAIEKAEAEAEAIHTANVAKASDKNWQASAWWLERRRPDEFARREKLEHTGKDGGPIDHRDITTLPDHEREALAEAIRRHLGGSEEPEPRPADASTT